MNIFIKNLLISSVVIMLLLGCKKTDIGPPFSPEDALGTFQLSDGFKIELVASEPEIKDPVDMAFDPDGRLYVVEMSDYPEADDPPSSRIMLLTDKDGDGRYESGSTFAQEIAFVNGVMPWKKGILVTAAPDIIYFEDTTGDGQADIREVVLSGFAVTNPQLRVSSLRFGLDNWIYGAYMDARAGNNAGGAQRYPEYADLGSPLWFPSDPINDSADISPGTDFRFKPYELKVEPSGGKSQFGLALDSEGNRFTVTNSQHIRHVVLNDRYTRINPYLSISSVSSIVPDHGDGATVYSITKNKLDLHESEIGHITSACGLSIYTGDKYPQPFDKASFVCEPVSNLVHVDLFSVNGGTYVGKRASESSEFLASTDAWFRPVSTKVGPDGALYVADFYRFMVEHPAWIARVDEKGVYTHAGILQEADFTKGKGLGRIYRIVPENFNQEEIQKPNLSKASSKTLVETLSNPNMWWRNTAQRLLIDREDMSTVPALKELTNKSSPFGKIHALWTLEGLRSLDINIILAVLKDDSPIVRKQGVILAENHLDSEEIQKALVEMGDDPDIHVRFQLTLTLCKLPHEKVFDTLLKIANNDLDEPWFQDAILIGTSESPIPWFHEISGSSIEEDKVQLDFLKRLASTVGAQYNTIDVSNLITSIEQNTNLDIQVSGLMGLSEGLRQGFGNINLTANGQDDLLNLIFGGVPEIQQLAFDIADQVAIKSSQAIQTKVKQAQHIVLNENEEINSRIHAVRMLGLDPKGLQLEILDKLLKPQQPILLQSAAAKVLLGSKDTTAITMLLKRWEAYTPEIRDIVEDGILSRQKYTSSLMDALVSGMIDPLSLNRTSKSKLLRNPDPEIRERAKNLFTELSGGNREEIVKAYYESTISKGDPINGEKIFVETCSPCHKVGDVGYDVGPDVLTVTNRTKVSLLSMILDPNSDISPGYNAFTIETLDGRTVTGVLVNESSTNVQLRLLGGTEQTVLRNNIKSLRPMGISLMPEGLEGNINKDEMADLLEYLQILGQQG